MQARRMISTLIGMLLLGVALAFGFWPADPKPERSAMPENVVQVEPVIRSAVLRQIRLSGITQASRRAVLSFTVPGRMEARMVDVGDRVTEGMTLAILDVRQYDHAVASTQARKRELEIELVQAERDRRRLATLVADKVVSVKDFERVSTMADALAAA